MPQGRCDGPLVSYGARWCAMARYGAMARPVSVMFPELEGRWGEGGDKLTEFGPGNVIWSEKQIHPGRDLYRPSTIAINRAFSGVALDIISRACPSVLPT